MGHRLSHLLETKRDPIADARIELHFAEANLTGCFARLAAGQDDLAQKRDPRDVCRDAVNRVFIARNKLDGLRYAALDIEATDAGRPLCPNDPDDVLHALLMAVDRIQGVTPVAAEGEVEADILTAGRRHAA